MAFANAKRTANIPTAAQLQNAADEGWDDWIRSAQDEAAVAQGCRFVLSKAERTRNFFADFLTHGKAPFAGRPFVLADWQWRNVIGPIYGWHRNDGTRRFDSAFVFVPKKNGKTQLAAGIALRELLDQFGARVYMSATANSQAADCYDESAGMVERNPHLKSLFSVRRSTYRILSAARNATLQTVTTSEGSSQGKNISCLIMDELHEWKNRAFFDSLIYGTAARLNSLVFMITTAGDNVTSICYEEYERAKRIVDGADMSINHLAVIYEAEKDGDWSDLEQWKKANPSYGITLPERKIKSAINEAKGIPSRVGAIKRYRLNQWTTARNAWVDVKRWDRQATTPPDPYAGQQCWGGLDLSRTRDFSAFARAFRVEDHVAFLLDLWMPEDRIHERMQSDRVPLDQWVADGWVHATPGDEIDYGEIRRIINAANNRTPIAELAYDPYNATHLCNQLLRGEDGINAIEMRQTMPYMSPPSAEFERTIGRGLFLHEHNPCVRWMLQNTVVDRDKHDNVQPVKGKSRGRIDAVIAMVMALGRLMKGEAARPTYYDSHRPEWF
ncbi:MAG: terminase TerL endonuclease subunit [Planctomycetota bacterium]